LQLDGWHQALTHFLRFAFASTAQHAVVHRAAAASCRARHSRTGFMPSLAQTLPARLFTTSTRRGTHAWVTDTAARETSLPSSLKHTQAEQTCCCCLLRSHAAVPSPRAGGGWRTSSANSLRGVPLLRACATRRGNNCLAFLLLPRRAVVVLHCCRAVPYLYAPLTAGLQPRTTTYPTTLHYKRHNLRTVAIYAPGIARRFRYYAVGTLTPLR